jgi:hypothetical protein
MNARMLRRRRLAGRLGLAGASIGVVAGLTQATVGDRIPEWTGAKQSPLALGLLTVLLSLVAGFAAARQRHTDLSPGARAGCAFGLVGPALLCLTTVGRLWFLPAVLLLAAGALTIDSRRDTASALAARRWPILLSALGGCELLMSAGAAPAPAVVGALGGAALIAAAWLDQQPGWTWALVVLGTLPFAVLAWTSIVPVLLTLEAFAVAAATRRTSERSLR